MKIRIPRQKFYRNSPGFHALKRRRAVIKIPCSPQMTRRNHEKQSIFATWQMVYYSNRKSKIQPNLIWAQNKRKIAASQITDLMLQRNTFSTQNRIRRISIQQNLNGVQKSAGPDPLEWAFKAQQCPGKSKISKFHNHLRFSVERYEKCPSYKKNNTLYLLALSKCICKLHNQR